MIETECTYLGDGVYVSFDGYNLVIRVNDHRSDPVVFLEPSVIDELMQYYQKIIKL
jgi:hypothetical protein